VIEVCKQPVEVLDEDADSDEGSDAGDVGAPTRQEAEQQDAQKVRQLLDLPG
jgi:hypothetical protein